MNFEFRQSALGNQVFTQDAFDAAIGQPVTVQMPSGDKKPAHLVGAKVSPDGKSAQVTVDISELELTEKLVTQFSKEDNG